MDGFDDLLSSSRHPFEDNPFANPFDKPRSSSPDPWSTFVQQERQDETSAGDLEGFQASVDSQNGGAEHEPQPPMKAHEYEDEGPLRVHDTDDSSTADDVMGETKSDTPHGDLQSPGFRESISTDDLEAKDQDHARSPTSSKSEATDDRPQHTSPGESPSQNGMPRPSTPKPEQGPSFTTPTPTSAKQFVSPLESPGPGVVAAFASLALGGESTGGWQDAPVDYTVATPQKLEDVRHEEAVEPTPEASEQKQPAVKENTESQPFFSISVEDPQKVGDPIRPYILYTVHTKTNSPLFSKPSFSVLRRYSDFLWLYETLCLNNPGVIVPPVPEKNPFGRFDNLFVQQRRLALEICIQKIASHAVLIKDPDFRLFLESDTFALDIKHRKAEMDRGGILSSIGQTLTGSKFLEVDDWFDKKKAYLDGLESQLKGLVKAIDLVSKQREELATSVGEFSTSITELSESDLSKDLRHSLSALGVVEKKAQDLQHIQAQEDTITLMTTVEEYSRIINSVRMAFASRVRCHTQWQNAESELRRVKQSYERARNQGRIPQERMGYSLAQIAEAERRAVGTKHEFEGCSRLVKSELARFEDERIGDFKKALELFLEGMIKRQVELVKAWEGYQELLLKKVNSNSAARGSEENNVADGVGAS